jgi:hypothetical protein
MGGTKRGRGFGGMMSTYEILDSGRFNFWQSRSRRFNRNKLNPFLFLL